MERLNGSTFTQKVLQSDLPVLVDFYADWCGPCQMQAPIIHQLEKDYEGVLRIMQVNVDHAPELAASYGVASIPTLLYFQNGEVKGKNIGFIRKEELEQQLDVWRNS